jgi:hypothetical protein
MQHVHKIVGLFLASLLVVCAASPLSRAEESDVPRDRVYNPALLSPTAQRSARLILTRDATYYPGSAASIDVFVEGQRLARLAERETVTFYVTPGKHIVGARFAWGPGPSMEREFVAETQKPVRIRVSTEPYSGKL